MFLVPPHAVEVELLKDFVDEFKIADVKMNGCEGLDKFHSVEEWLEKRPWLRNTGQCVFFSILREGTPPIGCIRLTPNISVPLIEHHGFNIGYSIRPTMQRHGYGRKQLNCGLQYLKSFGLDRALVAASDKNPASQHVILACGGTLIHSDNGECVYAIDLNHE